VKAQFYAATYTQIRQAFPLTLSKENW
jgi:hypothetical protein